MLARAGVRSIQDGPEQAFKAFGRLVTVGEYCLRGHHDHCEAQKADSDDDEGDSIQGGSAGVTEGGHSRRSVPAHWLLSTSLAPGSRSRRGGGAATRECGSGLPPANSVRQCITVDEYKVSTVHGVGSRRVSGTTLAEC